MFASTADLAFTKRLNVQFFVVDAGVVVNVVVDFFVVVDVGVVVFVGLLF